MVFGKEILEVCITVNYQIIVGAFICFNHNRTGAYLGPDGNLGQAFNSFLTKILLSKTRKLWLFTQIILLNPYDYNVYIF